MNGKTNGRCATHDAVIPALPLAKFANSPCAYLMREDSTVVVVILIVVLLVE